jgi:UDP:flavonoid glycosyltransferase YjiC (YdhE family)
VTPLRILLACVAGSQQHLNCLLPLARSAAAAGDTVAIASGPDRAEVVRSYGFPFFAVGQSFDTLVRRARRELDAYRLGGPAEEISTYARFFAGLAGPPSAADLVGLVQEFSPDLVIHETAEFGAPLAATLCRIPYATVSCTLPVPQDHLLAAGSAIAGLWEHYALAPDRYGGLYRHLGIDIFPASLRGAAVPTVSPVQCDLRPTAASVPGQGELRDWVGPLEDRPTVHVSFGTAAWNRSTEQIAMVVDALSAEDVNVVVAVGPGNDPADLGSLPANAVIRPFIPHSLMMPGSAVVVTHGGAGTTLSALEFGVPLLLMPQGGDQFRTAHAVEAAAAGVTVGEAVSGEAIRLGVRLLLTHPLYRAGAARMAADIAAMPWADDNLDAVKAALVTADSKHHRGS